MFNTTTNSRKIPMVFREQPSKRAELSQRIAFLSGLILGSITPKKVAASDKGFLKEYKMLGKEQQEQKLKALMLQLDRM